jgi:hypothetical protein
LIGYALEVIVNIGRLDFIRAELDDEMKEAFWNSLEESGGIKKVAQKEDISENKFYNWKSKNSFIPVRLIDRYLNEWKDSVEAYKGRGRSKPVKNPEIPIPVNDELLTRRKASVNVNKKGVPVYQTEDLGLLERFNELLQLFGDVPVKIYHRDVHELRYPAYLDRMMREMDFTEDIEALVDEEGEIREGKIVVEDKEVRPEKIDMLHHRRKKVKLALMKKDGEEVKEIISEEKRKVESLL